MLPLLPAVTYLAALLLSVALTRDLRPDRDHLFFWLFFAYSATYPARFILQAPFGYDITSLGILTSSEFTWTCFVMAFQLIAATVVYRIAFLLSGMRSAAYEMRAQRWIRFTKKWGRALYTHLFFIALALCLAALLIRFVVQGQRFVLGFSGDLESRRASLGWSFVPFILSQLSLAIFIVAIELRRPRRELGVLLFFQALVAVSSGSKGGFVIPLVWGILYGVVRGVIRLTPLRAFAVIAVAFVSIAVGTVMRAAIETGGWSPTQFASVVAIFGPALGRFFSFDVTQIMIAHPVTYSDLVPTYRLYSISAIVPSAVWPSKPLNPCFALANGVGFPLSCINGGWVGGLLVLTGPVGVVLPPLVIGYTFARIARAIRSGYQDVSLHHALLFMTGILWLGTVNEGGYYQMISTFFPLVALTVAIFLWIVFMRGEMGLPPSLLLPQLRKHIAR